MFIIHGSTRTGGFYVMNFIMELDMNLSNNMLRVAYELMYGKVPLKRFYWIRTIATLERSVLVLTRIGQTTKN